MSAFSLPDGLRAKLQSRELKRNKNIKEKKEPVSKTYSEEIFQLRNDITNIINTINSLNDVEGDYSSYIPIIFNDLEKIQLIFDVHKNQFSSYFVKKHQLFLQDTNKFLQLHNFAPQPYLKLDSIDGIKVLRKSKENFTDVELNNLNISVEKPFIENLENVDIIISEDLKDKDLLIQNVKHSTILIKSIISNLRCVQIEDCIIKTGPISSSAFMEGCNNSKINVISQQLRIHDCRDSNFYVFVVSRTIVEDSSGLTFAPYTWDYDGLNCQLDSVKISKEDCDWKKVDDFNWANPFEPSPNFVIKE